MLAASRIKQLYLAYFSKPASDRVLNKAIHDNRWRRFLEIGVGRGERALRMLDLAGRQSPKAELFYAGIDLFEARPAAERGLNLKDAHRLFKSRGLKAQLLPGDPYNVLARAANSLPELDVVIIAADQDADSLARCWFYLPRMLHATSAVFMEPANPTSSTPLLSVSREEIDARARRPKARAA